MVAIPIFVAVTYRMEGEVPRFALIASLPEPVPTPRPEAERSSYGEVVENFRWGISWDLADVQCMDNGVY